MDYDIRILYATQTGNAKLASEELERELLSYKLRVNTSSIEDYAVQCLPNERLVIFIVSTTGYGEVPSSMKRFWKFLLLKDLDEDSLEDVNFTIFGLGDSSYDLFNQTAKLLNNRLQQLSANLIFPLALGDDQHDFGWEGEFDPWVNKLVPFLIKLLGNSNDKINLEYESKYIVKFLTEKSNEEVREYIRDGYFNGCINSISNLTPIDYPKKIFKVEIKRDEHISIVPGDIINIIPPNDDILVDKFLSLYGFKGDELIRIQVKEGKINTGKFPINVNISIKDFLYKYLNLGGIPNRYFCKIASKYTQDIFKEKLELFASKTTEGKDEFYRYSFREKRNFLDILHDFKCNKISLEILIDLIGPIQPREFSISRFSEKFIEITVGYHLYYTFTGKEKVGIFSNYINKISQKYSKTEDISDNLQYTIRKGDFPLLKKEDNLIIISTGTGIAPFICLLDNIYDKCYANIDIERGTTLMFNGVRNKDKDFIYSDYLNLLLYQYPKNFYLFNAFSRDQDHKLYVQHLMKEQSKFVFDMIFKKRCHILLVGNSKTLPKSVDKAIKDIHKMYDPSPLEEEKEQNSIKALYDIKISNRYYIETW